MYFILTKIKQLRMAQRKTKPSVAMPTFPNAALSDLGKDLEKRLKRIETNKAINILLLGETGVRERYYCFSNENHDFENNCV